MESFLTIRIKTSGKQRNQVESVLTRITADDTPYLYSALRSIDEVLVAAFEPILSNTTLKSYLKDLNFDVASRYTDAKDYFVDVACGGHGLELLIYLMHALRPLSEDIEGTYCHDGEQPENGDWPMKISFNGDALELNSVTCQLIHSDKDCISSKPAITPRPTLATIAFDEISDICNRSCGISSGILNLLQSFEAISGELFPLTSPLQPGCGNVSDVITDDNLWKFRNLRFECEALITHSGVEPYLADYFSSILTSISNTKATSEIIKMFENAAHFALFMTNFFESDSQAKNFLVICRSAQDFQLLKADAFKAPEKELSGLLELSQVCI